MSQFQEFKQICVPLLASAHLTPSTIPKVSQSLNALLRLLQHSSTNGSSLSSSLCAYVYFPISVIFERNSSSDIPDYVLEPTLSVLELVIQNWWWTCDVAVWNQMFMLSAAILGGLQTTKSKSRDEETKLAAVRCLFQLVNPIRETLHKRDPLVRVQELCANTQSEKFLPVLGKAVDTLLSVVESPVMALQLTTLKVLHSLIHFYLAQNFIPTVLPGIVSRMCQIALGVSSKKGWANGDVVAAALSVMGTTIVGAMADEVCVTEGALRSIETLDDLASSPPTLENLNQDGPSYVVRRTSSWLQGTSSQVHIALNSLSPLMTHPTASASLGLLKFSESVILATPATLPQSHPLLLLWILTLSRSDFTSVKDQATRAIVSIISSDSHARDQSLTTLISILGDSLAILPHLIRSGTESQVENVAGRIEATCLIALADTKSEKSPFHSLLVDIGHLLGPAGGVEKWGWSLVSVLRIESSISFSAQASQGQLALEADSNTSWAPFPAMSLKNISRDSTYQALCQTLRRLGEAGGDKTLYSIDWFFRLGRKSDSPESIAALWIAKLLLEGSAQLVLEPPYETAASNTRSTRSLDKFMLGLCLEISDFWDSLDTLNNSPDPLHTAQDSYATMEIEHLTGVDQLKDNLKILRNPQKNYLRDSAHAHSPDLQRSLLLHLLSISSGVLQAKFPATFIQTLYPILHSLVSTFLLLSTTALATLHFITVQSSYASPSNLLLSNFDYALDSVSRRLNRRWLDGDAAAVLAMLVRLVGADVVDRAGDVVEECFDRLDDYHGYSSLVDGLTEVLHEVVQAISSHSHPSLASSSQHTKSDVSQDGKTFSELQEWLINRQDPHPEEDETYYGPAPQRPWTKAPDADEQDSEPANESGHEPPVTHTQLLTQQIIARASHLLSHGSPIVRARILNLLASSVSQLDASHLMSYIHTAWPFVLNRLGDTETFVVSATTTLVESLANSVGELMFFKVWDDVWPRFKVILNRLETADSQSALVMHHKSPNPVGTESAYTHSHKLYSALLRTMTAAARGVDSRDSSVWEVIVAFRRFLQSSVHKELQSLAVDLYVAISLKNADPVWLALTATFTENMPSVAFLREPRWDGFSNVSAILQQCDEGVI